MNLRNRILMLSAALMLPLALTSCKDSSTNVTLSKPQLQIGQTITKDTLSGAIKGTMLSGKTYYFANDIVVNAGDTLVMQNGVHLIALPPSAASGNPGPQITVLGTFVSLGTKDAQNWITVPDPMRTYDNLNVGLWGGIQGGPTSGDIIIKWTHVEYVGGPAGTGNPLVKAGDSRYAIWFQSVSSNFILENSWIRGTVDDPIRVSGGKISVMANTFEYGGGEGGDGLNIKSGTTGDIGYNLFIGDATNGPKLSNKGGSSVQTNCNIYNNTIVNCGWRMVESGRAGSTNIEEGARGTEYNNLIVNCRTGFRLVGNPPADTLNTNYDYQEYYGQSDSIRLKFYPSDGVEVARPHDIAGATKANDPMFVKYDVNQFDFNQASLQWPVPMANQPHAMNEQGTSDFHLRTGSPAIGKGYLGLVPLKKVPQGGDLGATTLGPGKDMGAYQTDGSGNQH